VKSALSDKSALALRLIDALGRHVGQLTAQTIVETSCWRARAQVRSLRHEELGAVVPELEKGVKLFVKEPFKQQLCMTEISELARKREPGPQLPRIVKVAIVDENGMVEARGRARQIAADLGFSVSEQTQIATVVSELARNIVLYAGTGTVTIIAFPAGRPNIQITAEDQGPGIQELDVILSGQRRSKTGMGLGLRGSRNLMDHFDIDTGPDKGTRVVATKYRR
jgi:serine/threonine-protein kinase RsbT